MDGDFHELEDVVTRYYEKGFVVITRSAGSEHFEPDRQYMPDHTTGLWDVYEGARIWGWPQSGEMTIQPADYPATGSTYPSGRVYVYLTGADAD